MQSRATNRINTGAHTGPKQGQQAHSPQRRARKAKTGHIQAHRQNKNKPEPPYTTTNNFSYFFLILRHLLSKSLFTFRSFTLIYGTSATSAPISTLVYAKVYKKTPTNQNKGLLHNAYVQAVPLRALLRRKNTSAQSRNFTSSRFRPHSTIYTSITKTKGNHSLLTKAYTPSTNCPPVKRSQDP